jgi:hypothetical protein
MKGEAFRLFGPSLWAFPSRPDIVEIHRPPGAAEAPGDRVVSARRLMRRLEGPEPDALAAAADLGVERAVWPCLRRSNARALS